MGGTPNRNDIVERYNESCAAFQAASDGLRKGTVGEYELKIRQAATSAIGALEWTLQVYLEHECGTLLSAEDRKKLKDGHFLDWLELTKKAHPPVDLTTRTRLREYRNLRNKTEHGGNIPSNAAVFSALKDIRRFLIERLLIAPERLRTALLVEKATKSLPDGAPTEVKPVSNVRHRELGPKKWLNETLASGIARARQKVGERYDATLDSLSIEAQSILTLEAEALALNGHGPAEVISTGDETVEEEMQRILSEKSATALGAADVERLRRLLPLLTRRSSLCIEAGWLHRQPDGVRFSETLLPALLLSGVIAAGADDSSLLRGRVGAQRAWAETAWAAVSEGDDLANWATQLMAETASPALLDRVVVTCAAFGGMGAEKGVSTTVIDAFRLCVMTLVWFSPRLIDVFQHPMEHDSPWFLPADSWQRCLLDLAHAAGQFSDDARFSVSLSDCQHPPDPLQHLVTRLNMRLRLSEDAIAALLMVCAPRQTLRSSTLSGLLFSPLFRTDQGMRFDAELLAAWFQKHGIPAMYAADRLTAARLLAQPGENHPAGFLLLRGGLLDAWWKAWQLLATTAEHEIVVDAFVKALGFLRENSDEKTLKVVSQGFQQLEQQGLSAQVATRLGQTLKPIGLDPDEQAPKTTVQIEMLRHAALSLSDLAQLVEQWTAEPALAWRTLLQAGAPDTAIARWCVAKLSEREKAPSDYRDDPVGLAIRGGSIATRTGDWQLAFRQVWEALDWVLSEGSADAIGIIADACIKQHDSTTVVDPIVGKWEEVNIPVPLSQILWGRVLKRTAGRSAFLSFIERGRVPGQVNFLDDSPMPVLEDSLWLRVAMGITDSRRAQPSKQSPQDSSPPETKRDKTTPSVQEDAQRLLLLFEQRLLVAPWLANLNGQPVRAAVTTLAAMGGADVSKVLRSLFQELASANVATHQGALRASLLCNPLGSALFHLCCHHRTLAVPLLDDALSPLVLAVMRRDETRLFWLSMFHHHGAGCVLSIIDKLAWRDIGLGLFDALQEIDEPLLRRRQLHPEMLRATLIRAAEQKFRPAPEFWAEAWTAERNAAEIPELVGLTNGEWLNHLLVKSAGWSAEGRARLLRQLAFYAQDATVRERCTEALCKS